MTKKRRQYDAQYKFRVALEAAKGNKTVSELASETAIHPSQIGAGKRQILENGGEVFSRNGSGQKQAESDEADLYEQIGRGTLWVQNGAQMAEKKVAAFD